jgi:hypothetical protein
MSATLEEVADRVNRRAQRQGYVLPHEIREELAGVGLDAELWREVVNLAGATLQFRSGRYHYRAPVSERVRQEQSQQEQVSRAVRALLRQRETAAQVERRGEERTEFVQPVQVFAEDGREFTLLTRDLSTTGIRLIGTHRLLGQKLRVLIPSPTGGLSEFCVRILWTCPVGDDLVENGGTFLAVTAAPEV